MQSRHVQLSIPILTMAQQRESTNLGKAILNTCVYFEINIEILFFRIQDVTKNFLFGKIDYLLIPSSNLLSSFASF